MALSSPAGASDKPSPPIELPSFEEFVADTDVLKLIEAINLFQFTVRYQESGAVDDPRSITALRAEGYAVLNDLLETSGIHYLHALEGRPARSKQPSGDEDSPVESRAAMTFTLTHDLYHCEVALYSDRLTITRKSSSMEDFYNWYCMFMPHALSVETALRKIVESATSSTLRAVHSSFDFRLNFADFRKLDRKDSGAKPPPQGKSARWRNIDVLKRIIPSVPAGREMVELPRQRFYRLDLTLSQLQEFSGRAQRNTWYYVEAPFNENGRYIVFRAELRNAAAEVLNENGKVEQTLAFDPNYGDDYYRALVEFLRDRALEDFLYTLFDGWDFTTERLL